MALQLGANAPNFKAETTMGPIEFHRWAGERWVLFFSHPADFTPVCTTELARVGKLKREFERRSVKILGLSVDSLDNHVRWLEDIEATQGVKLNFPVIADTDRRVSNMYEMLQGRDDLLQVGRATYVIDPERKIRLVVVYPESTGRNFHEILRAIDALQLTTEYGVSTPVDWVRGQDVLIPPDLSDREITARFPEGYREVNHYLRMAADPLYHPMH